MSVGANKKLPSSLACASAISGTIILVHRPFVTTIIFYRQTRTLSWLTDDEETKSRASSSPLWLLVRRHQWQLDRLVKILFSGASGTGRTTFVNTLCESGVLSHKVCDDPHNAHVEEPIRIKPHNVGAWKAGEFIEKILIFSFAELEEDGIRIALTVVDTPGFGDNIDNESA